MIYWKAGGHPLSAWPFPSPLLKRAAPARLRSDGTHRIVQREAPRSGLCHQGRAGYRSTTIKYPLPGRANPGPRRKCTSEMSRGGGFGLVRANQPQAPRSAPPGRWREKQVRPTPSAAGSRLPRSRAGRPGWRGAGPAPASKREAPACSGSRSRAPRETPCRSFRCWLDSC